MAWRHSPDIFALGWVDSSDFAWPRRSSSVSTPVSLAPLASSLSLPRHETRSPSIRVPVTSTDGLLLVDKPAGMTSHDVVAIVRRSVSINRVGHTGTLDPFATGLLVLLAGRATRLARFVADDPKVYEATIAFGSETATDDLTGAVTRRGSVPSLTNIRQAIPALTGQLHQVPPAYSAKQIGGRRSYDAARHGQILELPASPVTVHEWHLHAFRDGVLSASVVCGGGTYVRALARDLGRLTESAAHLASLRRTQAGSFRVHDAHTIDSIKGGDYELRPSVDALAGLASEFLTERGVADVRHGRTVPATVDAAHAALIAPSGELIAVAQRQGHCWHPRVVLSDA